MLILDRLNITGLFDVIVDGTKVANAKPDPEVFVRGAAELGVEPEFCVVFEDAEAGVEAAINAKMKCVGIGEPSVLHQANVVVSGLNMITVQEAEQL